MDLVRYPEYKDSSIGWIGEIPEYWEIKRFKSCFSYVKGKKPLYETDSYDKYKFPYLSMEYLRENESTTYCLEDHVSIKVNDGDLLLLWDGSNAGEFILGKHGYLSSTMVKLILKEILSFDYSKYCCQVIEPVLKKLTIGMGISHVNSNILYNMPISVPPLTEQKQIANYLDKEISKIIKAINKIKEHTELLEEYKESLIYNVVTGKVDVRGEDI
jgi:type I restriction enzyme S subunit